VVSDNNIIEVRIAGTEYRLKGNENNEYMHKIASYVDKKMQDIVKSNSRLNTSMAAILSSINIADDLHKSYLEIEDLKRKIEQLQEENERYKAEHEHLLKDNRQRYKTKNIYGNNKNTTPKNESR